MILVVDNFDSFVFNLARTLVEAGAETAVVRNDALDPAWVADRAPEAIVVSPGPCGPAEAGAAVPIIRAFAGRIPILGVCLGHQCIAAAFGGRVGRARAPMHGRAAPVRHDGTGPLAGLPSPFAAGRYHSLIVDLDPAGPLRATGWSPEGEVMALAHRDWPLFGVQFHPESILTEHGHRLLGNFLTLARAFRPR